MISTQPSSVITCSQDRAEGRVSRSQAESQEGQAVKAAPQTEAPLCARTLDTHYLSYRTAIVILIIQVRN